MKNQSKSHWLLVAMFILMTVLPTLAFAQDFSSAPSGAQIATNMTTTTNAFWNFIQAVVCLVGFIMVCVGLYGFYKVTKEKGQGQSSIPLALTGCVVGVLMIMLPLTVGTLGKSVFGDQAARPARIQLTPQ